MRTMRYPVDKLLMAFNLKIRAALDRTRKARAKTDKRIRGVRVNKEIPELEIGQPVGASSHPGDDPVQPIDQANPSSVPAR